VGISDNNKLKIFHVINHIAIIPALLYGQLSYWLIAYLVWGVIASIGVSTGLHRLLCHQSFKCPLWFEQLATYVSCLSTAGSPLGWAGVHRLHHIYVDRTGDPHGPMQIGFLNAYVHNWGDVQIERKYIKDLLKKPHVMFCHKMWWIIILLYVILLLLFFGSLGVIFGYCVPGVMAFHGMGWVNAVGHSWGYRNYKTRDKSYNNPITNILTFGEGWHNNHHHDPNNWRLGKKWWEWDPTSWIIRLVKL
jgi:stearoyl-CoA desaturase (delta-9 desaturase)